MTQGEFESWMEFYSKYPFDDMHRFHMPAALVAQKMGGGDVRPMLRWLQPGAFESEYSDADASFLKAFGLQTGV